MRSTLFRRHMSESKPFCAWLISRNITTPSSSHATVNDKIHSFLWLGGTECVYQLFKSWWSLRLSSHSYFVNSTFINMGVLISLFPLSINPVVWTQDYIVVQFSGFFVVVLLCFWGATVPFSTAAAQTILPTASQCCLFSTFANVDYHLLLW